MQTFENAFFSTTMKQSFNDAVFQFISDEFESAIHKWLRATGRLG